MNGTWQPSPRRRRRNLLLLAGLVPSLIAVTVATALLVMLQRQSDGLLAEQRGDHDAGRAAFAANRWAGTVEHWIAPYDEGVATFRSGALDDALSDFEAALELAPAERQCLVLHNIAVTQEALGDRLAGARTGVGERAEDGAVGRYREGRSTLSEQSCLTSVVDPELRERSELLDEQLGEKILAELARQQQEERERLTPEERAAVDNLDVLDDRAEGREQEAEDEQPPHEPPHEPPHDAGAGDEGVVYGW